MTRFDVRVLLPHLLENALPQIMGEGHRIGFIAHADALQSAMSRVFERMPDDALDSFARVDVLLHSNIVTSPFFEETAYTDIKALCILPENHELHVGLLAIAQWSQPLVKQFHGSRIDVKI